MEHVNTLKMYKDLVNSGVPEQQAEAHVLSLNTSFESVATTKDLLLLEKDLKYFFTWEIGAALIVTLIFPLITKKFVR